MDSSGLGPAYHAGNHYENFPVASWLIPAGIRPAVISLYHFARTGDDLADEGHLAAAERLAGLKALSEALHAEPPDPLGHPGQLAIALRQKGIPLAWAQALLDAFIQDVGHEPMADQAAVLRYCSLSANPVGRLLLALAGFMTPDGQQDISPRDHPLIDLSDAICSGLQLANFAQDLGQDVGRGRVYFPKEWWPEDWQPALGVAAINRADRIRIARALAHWAEQCLSRGARLPRLLLRQKTPYRLRFAYEIAVTLEGGFAICRKVRQHPTRVWQDSPRISKWQLPLIGLRAARRLL